MPHGRRRRCATGQNIKDIVDLGAKLRANLAKYKTKNTMTIY
jgi:hypothetical protein